MKIQSKGTKAANYYNINETNELKENKASKELLKDLKNTGV